MINLQARILAGHTWNWKLAYHISDIGVAFSIVKSTLSILMVVVEYLKEFARWGIIKYGYLNILYTVSTFMCIVKLEFCGDKVVFQIIWFDLGR